MAGSIQPVQAALTGIRELLHSSRAAAVLLAGFSWELSLPYLSGIVIFIIGVVCIRTEVARAQGVDKIISFGSVFFAAAMGVFGTDHFVFSESVVAIMPVLNAVPRLRADLMRVRL